jgi:hypothetical protein
VDDAISEGGGAMKSIESPMTKNTGCCENVVEEFYHKKGEALHSGLSYLQTLRPSSLTTPS